MDSSDDEARAYCTARELIAEHGDDVGRVLQDKIDMLIASRDYEQLSAWFLIRNCVGIMSLSESTPQ